MAQQKKTELGYIEKKQKFRVRVRGLVMGPLGPGAPRGVLWLSTENLNLGCIKDLGLELGLRLGV